MSRWLIVVLSALLVAPAWADQQQPKKMKKSKTKQTPAETTPADRSKQAVTDVAQADSDFALQGEYMGPPQVRWAGAELIGLQVIALGDGKFEGVLLRGGLPGAGWDRRTKVTVSGELQSRGRVSPRREPLPVLTPTTCNGGMALDPRARVSERRGHFCEDVTSAVLRNDDFEIVVSSESALVKGRRGEALAQIRKWRRISPTLDEPPPPGALVLFDGTGTGILQNGKLTADRLLEVGASTAMPVNDFQLHLEFRTPYMPYARGQGRGNSGIYIQQRYEVQVLDSFGLEGADNECGGLYKQRPPAVNMCLPPLSWQTYDIYFSAARWNAAGEKRTSARITLLHNGEPVHVNYDLTAKTGGGKTEGPEPFPILFQNHGNPVHYRNIWIIPQDSNNRRAGTVERDTACDVLVPTRPGQFGRSMPRSW